MNLDVSLLRSSLEKMKPIAGQISDRFYEVLWADYPESKALFKDTQMGPQKFSFFNALTFIIDHIDKPEDLEPYLRGLGSAHVSYGVQDHHYGWVGVSMLKTFSVFFGESWTEVLSREWANVFSLISGLMLEGAKDTTKGVNDNPVEKARHIVALAQDAAHVAAVAAGISTPESWADKRGNAPVQTEKVPMDFELPQDVRDKIRNGVQEAIRDAIRREVDRIAREEIERITRLSWAEYLKTAA